MKYVLTLRKKMSSREGPKLGDGTVTDWEVCGLPHGEQADITISDGRWCILRIKNGVQGDWTGDFTSAEEALRSLGDEFAD